MAVERALISTFDKTGLDAFARGLSDLGVELVASGGTAADIAELGIDVTPVEDVTDFQQVAAQKDVREEDAVEMIDIGGPAMLRAAAKNFRHVIPVCRAERYAELLAHLDGGGDVDRATRRELAAEAFAHTA